MKILLILIGLLGGTLAGMGMGGGNLLIPMLTFFLSFTQKQAQLTNLICFIPTALIATIIHSKKKLVNWKLLIPILITAIPSAILISILANRLDNQILSKLYAIFLLLTGATMLALIPFTTAKVQK